MTLFAYLTENLTSFTVACIFFHVVTNLSISKIMKILTCVEQDKNVKYNLCYYKLNELESIIDALEEKVEKLTEYNTNLQENNKVFTEKLRFMIGENNSTEQTTEANEVKLPILGAQYLKQGLESQGLESQGLESQGLDEDAPCFKSPFLQSQELYLKEDTNLHANALLDENNGLNQINTILDKDYEHVTDKPSVNTSANAANTSYSYWSVFA